MVIKRSPGGQACRWRAINFEIHLWSSGKNADCIFGDRSASSMSKWRPAWTLTPEMIHFRTKSVTLSMLIDLLIVVHVDRRRWRAHQLTYDLKRCLLFRKCLRFFESESSFGAYVCHRRPGGSMATSHLVNPPSCIDRPSDFRSRSLNRRLTASCFVLSAHSVRWIDTHDACGSYRLKVCLCEVEELQKQEKKFKQETSGDGYP